MEWKGKNRLPSSYLRINLDALADNLALLRRKVPLGTKVIAIVKANAYGHGSLAVANYLKSAGVERLAVATIREGAELRVEGQIAGPIHMLGSMDAAAAADVVKYDIIPTLCTTEALDALVAAVENDPQQQQRSEPFKVHVKVDTGLSRVGVQPDELDAFLHKCRQKKLHVEGLFTHFADSWNSSDFTLKQWNLFNDIMQKVAKDNCGGQKMYFHAGNTGAILKGIATHLDFVRPGISMYGLPLCDIETFQPLEFKPLAAWVVRPTLVKTLAAGRVVGYGMHHEVQSAETVATFPLGYADGYRRLLSRGKGVFRCLDDNKNYPVIGNVSMDQTTISAPAHTTLDTEFLAISDDYDPDTSVKGIANKIGSHSYEVAVLLGSRVPRFYVLQDKLHRFDAKTLQFVPV
eukprot:m.219154 g.219154  ORF g.219154 m.219154 type:complete len:405 (+) comp60525_c0_seq1:33-1247(+)